MARGLKILGIDTLGKKEIAGSFLTLFLFGFASSGLYDLWKLVPTLFIEGPKVPDWENLIICGFPVVLAAAWFIWLYFRYRGYFDTPQAETARGTVLPHRGIVLVLSTPRLSVDEIVAQIQSCSNDTGPDELFKIQGIGQLFKGLCHHREKLCYAWLVVTDQSAPYTKCIESFLGKFIPSAKVSACLENKNGYLVRGKSQQDEIESTKALLKHIYSNTELERTGLKKSDIIVDITGGPKHITIGLIFGALDSSIDIQYTEQSEENNVIPLNIDHRIILDKTSDYLLELYRQMNPGRPRQQ